jgi:hypothetical protein
MIDEHAIFSLNHLNVLVLLCAGVQLDNAGERNSGTMGGFDGHERR